MDQIPDHSTVSPKLSSERRTTVLERFFQHIVSDLPTRRAVVSTNATGYSGRKRGWREMSHANRTTPDWIKANVIIEVDEFIILACILSNSNVHESQTFRDVWERLLDSIIPIRSLADSAYVGNECLAVARQHGATPLHKIKRNAKDFEEPKTLYQRLVNFANQ